MKILFDLNHPAHVHLFKNFIFYLRDRGHFVFVVSRDKDVSKELLDYYGINHLPLSAPKSGLLNMVGELLHRDIAIYKLNKEHKFDLAFGCSVSIAHISAISKMMSFNFCEDDDDYIPLYVWSTYPFTTKIVNNRSIRHRFFKNKRVFHNSYHKLAYLHPNNFKPNLDVVRSYGLEPSKYIVIRNSALKAHHDAQAKGLTGSAWDRVASATKGYKLVFSKESNKEHQIKPWDMHHVLAFAKLVVTDSLSMSVEASVLGTPVVRYNSFEGKSSVLNELQNKYNLAFGYNAKQEGSDVDMANKVKELLQNNELNNEWQAKRRSMLNEKEEMNQWMIDFFENELNEDKR